MPTIVTVFVVVIGGLLAILYRAKEKVPRLQDIVSSFVGLLVFRLDDGRSLDRLSLEEIEAFATLHYN
jgi:hypothetical protein